MSTLVTEAIKVNKAHVIPNEGVWYSNYTKNLTDEKYIVKVAAEEAKLKRHILCNDQSKQRQKPVGIEGTLIN